MTATVSRLTIGLLVLLLAPGGVVFAQDPAKQKLAEETADRIIKHFSENLDFRDIVREDFIKNVPLKEFLIDSFVDELVTRGDASLDPTVLKTRNIDPSAKERLYIAQSNVEWLLVLDFWTYDTNDKEFQKEVAANIREYGRLAEDKSTPIITSEQCDEQLTARLNLLLPVFRHYVVKSRFDTPEFKRAETSVKETESPLTMEKLRETLTPLGVKADETIYVARRSNFYIYLVEESGQFRMFAYSGRR